MDSDRNNNLIVNVICVFFILKSFFYVCSALTRSIIFALKPEFEEYLVNYYGEGILGLLSFDNVFWVIYSFLFGVTSILTLRRKNYARETFILLAAIGIIASVGEMFFAYNIGNFIYKFSALLSLQAFFYDTLFLSVGIYVFTRPFVKNEFTSGPPGE